MAAGPFVASCSLLVIAGSRKVVQPGPARAAVAAAALPLPRGARARFAVVAFGLFEVSVGLAGVVFGGPAALAVAACYLALGAFAWRLLRRAPATPCACLGASNATVSRVHVIVDIAAVGAALAAAAGGSPVELVVSRSLASIVFGVLVGCCVVLVALALDTLPVLAHAMRNDAS
jgi:hypothetical protein